MVNNIIAATESEAVSAAKKESAASTKRIYLFYCVKKQEYSISRYEMPYAPIISGGYVPTAIASFINGVKI
jgi:hypothetical protein